jgi:hypothetical protein
VSPPTAPGRDLICLSHLRWSFVFQRPNHLLTQCSRERRVFFVEEPVLLDPADAGRKGAELAIREVSPQLYVVTPQVQYGSDVVAAQRELLQQLYQRQNISAPIVWFYTPMALEFACDLPAVAHVYDCMDELSAFRGAPRELQALERELFGLADLVFTGGQSLFERKRNLHPSVHLFPSNLVRRAEWPEARRYPHLQEFKHLTG